MKKLLAGLLIGGLFSLGCGDTTTKPAPKTGTPPVNKKMNGKDEDNKMKDEGTKPETKKDDSKKNEPKKDSN